MKPNCKNEFLQNIKNVHFTKIISKKNLAKRDKHDNKTTSG